MTYSSPPSYKIPYDIDGTYVFTCPDYTFASGAFTELSLGDKQGFNSEKPTWHLYFGANWPTYGLGFVFPQPINISGIHIAYYSSDPAYYFKWSSNTTNGSDGTWTDFSPTQYSPSTDSYRSIQPITLTGARGIRIGVQGIGSAEGIGIGNVHFYGTSTNAGLAMWDSALDQRFSVANLDLGDLLRTGTVQRQFRVKNQSSSTANGVTVASDILYDTSPSIISNLSYSLDNTTFTPSVSLGNLAAGAISPVVYMNYYSPANANLGSWAPRVTMSVTSWT